MISAGFITGFMVGIELANDMISNAIVIDLGIIRIVWEF